MSWKPINIISPMSWHRFKAWRWDDSAFGISVALNPNAMVFGFEVLTGFGRGLAIQFGPFIAAFCICDLEDGK